MSEYTDYYAIRVADPAALVPALNAAGLTAIVFDDLAGKARPAWVAVAMPNDDEAALAGFGPAVHLRLDEGQIGWQLSILGAPGVVTHSFFDRPFWYRDGSGREQAPNGFRRTAPKPLTDADGERLVSTFGVPWAELRPLLRAGGYAGFAARTGVPYLELLDQHLLGYAHRGRGAGRSSDGPRTISARELAD